MANGTRSSRKANDDEDNDSKGNLSSGKKSVHSGAAAGETSGVRRSHGEILSKKNMTPWSSSGTRKSERLEKQTANLNSMATPAKRKSEGEILSKKNMTPSSSSGTRKSERLEKQTANLNSMTPPAKRKSERIEKQKNPSPLRRSERGKMPSSSGSSGSKMSDKSPDLLDMKRKKEKKEKKVKQLTMQTVEINKFEQEDGQADEAQKKKMDARACRALFRKQPKKVGGTDHCDDLKETDSGRREDFLEELAERTRERTVVTSTSEFAKEALEKDNEHKLFPSSQMDSCEDISLNEDGLQVSKNGLVAGEMNDDAEKAVQENLQSPQLVNSILHGGVLDCDISLEMVQKVMPSKRKGHDIDIDSVASPIMSRKDICTSTGAGTLLSSGCRRNDCNETCGTCSKRQRVDCHSTKQEICSCNTKLNQLFGSSDIKDRGKLDVGISTGHVEKPCNCIQQHMSSADLQRGSDQSTCIVCKLDGELLCCHGKGCQRSYHLSCLEPPLEEFPLGLWYCLVCVRKKLESGVHSVSEGIEAIWDYREPEASEDGLRRQKQYFVKYKGLAHVHNRWLPENKVLLEAPSLVAEYNRKNQGVVWKQHWVVPHRVLQKRLLMTPKECDEHHSKGHDGDKLNCHVEWLVKWCGLGYEHASWELESASFFSCPEGQSLVRDYETRRMKAKRASKFDKERAVTSQKFSELPAGVLSGLGANLDAVNKLCNYWHRGQNAIIFYDQERIPNVIYSILSFPSDISRPFLIISTSTLLYSWDEEFLHLAPSANVVVYSGSKEIRNSIRNLEFYEGGCIKFQVLITSPEVISEDLNVLDCIGWEAIIVDDCQRPRIASCFEQIKMLTASKRLLVISSQLKDNVAEYLNLLSLLDSQSDSNGSDSLPANSSDNIGTLKERLAKYVAYKCKLESSRFLEYWVPVLLSNVQLEQYCFTLLSNSLSFCSPSKTDPVGALRSILISSRKCCDHPYVVNQSLQMLLTIGLKEVEFLDVGIKASGKLQLLDAMLLEIKKRELKVLILFQYIGGSGRDLMGDILDDFLRQRFGADSYERVDSGVIPTKKQSALNKFNNERERFVFLLETRACLPSIKLSAVGTVIIFGSDWSPMNDLRALQRITLDSQFEQIKVFRLYSSFTMEEKLLMLSKQDKTFESNIENISPSSSHMLLKWGASYLFSQLDKFHGIPTLDASTLSEQSHLKDVIQEFFILLHQTGIDKDASKLSLILQAKQNQGMYRTEMPLFGEQKIQVMNEEDPPHIFWTKLLEGKSPRWKYSSCSSQRNRKRVQYFDDLQKKPEAENAEVVKRRKKVVSDGNDHPSPKAGLQEGKIAAWDREGSSGTSAYGLSPSLSRSTASGIDKIHAASNSLHLANNISKIPALNMVEWESRRKQRDSQKNLHVLLRPQIAKLSEVLHLSEEVKAMVERFLEYVMDNNLVNREPATILQAFLISLCWSAASLLKQKIDHKESLALAKQHLGFTCKKEEADYVYSMLRCLKRMFLYRTGFLKVRISPKASNLSSKAVGGDYSNATSYQLNVNGKIEDLSGFQEGSDIQAIAESGVALEFQLAQRDLLKSIKEIQKKCDKQMKKLIEKQREEMKQFNQKYEEEKAQLEKKKRTEAAVIRLHSNVSMSTDKLKKLDIEYAKKFDELKQQIDLHLKNLEALQVAAKNNVQEKKTCWVEAVKFWARVELVKLPVNEANISEVVSSAGVIQSASGSEVRLSKIVPKSTSEVATSSDVMDNIVCTNPSSSKEQIPDTAALSIPAEVVSLTEPETAISEVLEGCSVHRENDGTSAIQIDRRDGGLCTMNLESEFQEASHADLSSVQPVSTSDQGGPLPPDLASPNVGSRPYASSGIQARDVENNEMRNASQVAETSPSNGTIDVACNVSNPDAPLFRSTESTSNLSPPGLPSVSAIEHQPSNEGQTANQISQAPRANHIELSNQDVLQPVHSPIDGTIGGLVRQASETRTASVPSVSSGLPLQTAVSSRMPLPLYHDPLQNEMERIHKEKDQTIKVYEDTKLQLKSQCQKEIEEVVAQIHRKYEVKLQEKEAEFLRQKKELDVNYNKVLLNKILAEAFRSKCINNRASGSAGIQQEANSSFMQQLQMVQQPSTASGLPSIDPATRMQTVSPAIVNAQTLSPPLQPSTASDLPSTDPATSMQTVSPVVVNAQTLSPPLQPSIASGLPSTDPVTSMQTVSPAVVNAQTLSPPLQPSIASGLPSTDPATSMQTVSPAVVNTQTLSPPLQSSTASGLPSTDPATSMLSPAVVNTQTLNPPLQSSTASGLPSTDPATSMQTVSPAVVNAQTLSPPLQPSTACVLPSTDPASSMQTVSPAVVDAQTLSPPLQPSTACVLPSTDPATSMQTVSPAVVNAQTLSPPLQPSTASVLPSTDPATMRTVSPAVVNAQTMGPHLQVVNPSEFFSGTPTRPSHVNSISPSTGNLQMGSEIRAPAPHLQPFSPSTSISPSSLPLQSSGMSSQQVHNNHPVASTSLLQPHGNPLAHRQASTAGQSGRIVDVLIGLNNLSGAKANSPSNLVPDISSSLAKLVPSIGSNPAQQSGATDIVCLSDVLIGLNNLSGAKANSPSNLIPDISSSLAKLVPSIGSNPAQQSGATDIVCSSDDD